MPTMSRRTTHKRSNNQKPKLQQQQQPTPTTATTTNYRNPLHTTTGRHTHTVDSHAGSSGRKGGLPCRSTAIRTPATKNQSPSSNQQWNARETQLATINAQATSHTSCKTPSTGTQQPYLENKLCNGLSGIHNLQVTINS